MSKYSTGEIAKLCGVSVRTIQYYDKRGILTPAEISEGGRRLYSEKDLNTMKVICFLRELDLSLDNIAKLLRDKNSEEVISLILGEHERMLKDEIAEKQSKLKRLEELHQMLKKKEDFSVKSIGDVAHVMKDKRNLRKLYATMLLTGLPVSALEVVSIILWATMGIWWPFAVYTVLVIPYAIWISKYYFKRVAYICPECHRVFKPTFKETFWANHTPTTRKLRCVQCGHKGFCVEIYNKEEK